MVGSIPYIAPNEKSWILLTNSQWLTVQYFEQLISTAFHCPQIYCVKDRVILEFIN